MSELEMNQLVAKGLVDEQEPSSVELSVVLPVYEEHETIAALIEKIHAVLGEAGLDYEIVAVDDGSQDQTKEVLTGLQAHSHGRLRVARHIYNKGNGAALRTGIRVSRGEIVVTMDADGQHAPKDILTLIASMPPYDLVIGARTDSYQGSWHRSLANGFYNRFASWLSQREILDLTSGFRAMRRTVVNHFLPLFPTGFSVPSTTTLAFLKAGYNVTFIPIHVAQRAGGKSKIRLWSDGARFVLLILRMTMLFDPLRIFMTTSIVLGLLGVLAGVAGVINARRLVVANSAILFFITALMTWLLGLIASQVSSALIRYHGDETILIDEPSLEEPETS